MTDDSDRGGTVRGGGDIFRIDLERLEQSEAKQQGTTTRARSDETTQVLGSCITHRVDGEQRRQFISQSIGSKPNEWFFSDR